MSFTNAVKFDRSQLADWDPSEVYLNSVTQEAVRVLGLMDREFLSPTKGCMDRTYWAWKFTDFPGARFQEGICSLSFLYATPFENNQYYRNPALLDWIVSGIDFWVCIQYNDGSFDEAYPFERSLAATAFTSFYLAEAWNFLEDQLPQPVADRLKESLRHAGEWLIKNDETHGFLSNHLAAAAAALLHISQITGDERFEGRSRFFLDKILAHQSPEGWYDEYGGADPGYQTHCSFYLARYWEISGDSKLAESLEHSFQFLAHFLHPDGSLGGEYASRNTQTYYPAAFEMMSGVSGISHWIAQEMLPSVQDMSAAGLGSVDAYNYFPLLNNNVFAYLACQRNNHRQTTVETPPEQSGVLYFPEAGIAKMRNEYIELYAGLTKGGVIKAFDRQTGQLIGNDCGYLGKFKSGKLFSSQWVDPDTKIAIQDDEIVVDGGFYQFENTVMSPVKFLLFRLFSLTAGRLPKVSYWLKSLLVNKLIYHNERLPITFSRKICIDLKQITIEDHLQGSIGDQIDTLARPDVFTTIHMGSSRYFVPNELLLHLDSFEECHIDHSKLRDGIFIERAIDLN